MGIKFAKTFVGGILGIILFAVLVCIMFIVIDDRCSKALDENDLVWDELSPDIKARVLNK